MCPRFDVSPLFLSGQSFLLQLCTDFLSQLKKDEEEAEVLVDMSIAEKARRKRPKTDAPSAASVG